MNKFISIKDNVCTEIVEKKSKFICNFIKVSNQDDAESVIKELKKRYYDARHNCVAYRVTEGDMVIEKSSDDGEPSGTAGAPMLNILQKSNMINVVAVVTRYFGGILLGTGGLVRAYSDVLLNAIEISEKVSMVVAKEAEAKIDYSNFDAFKYYCGLNDIFIKDVFYSDVIICKVFVNENSVSKLQSDYESKKINLMDLVFSKGKRLCENKFE